MLVHAAAGGTGLLLVQILKLAGAKVIGSTSTPEKKELAIRGWSEYLLITAGCDHVVLYKQEDLKEKVMEFTDGKGVSCVFDGVGHSTFDASLSCISRLGSMVSFGNASGKVFKKINSKRLQILI